MKKNILLHLLAVCLVAGSLADSAFAQSWDINKPIDLRDGIAEVVSVNPEYQTVNLRFYSTPAAGEYTGISCFFDGESSLKKSGKEIPFTDLTVGDRVVIESALLEKESRSCRRLRLAEDKPQPAAPAVAYTFGKAEAQVVSINLGLRSVSLKFFSGEGPGEFLVYSCFFDQESYLERDLKKEDWDNLKTGEWVNADAGRLKSSQRFCGSMKVIANPSGIIPVEKKADFGKEAAQLLSKDLSLRNLSLKVYNQGDTGPYAVISCFLDENSYLEKNGKEALLADLNAGDWLAFNPSNMGASQRSCGALRVIPKP